MLLPCFQTPWNTFRKAYFTNDLVDFALTEFNQYPVYLAANRTRPPYIPGRYPWPPKWVTETAREGRMKLNRQEFLKYIMILYLLGAKGLADRPLDEMFSNDPIMREEWLCQLTTRRDMRRFLRQVCTNHTHTLLPATCCSHYLVSFFFRP